MHLLALPRRSDPIPWDNVIPWPLSSFSPLTDCGPPAWLQSSCLSCPHIYCRHFFLHVSRLVTFSSNTLPSVILNCLNILGDHLWQHSNNEWLPFSFCGGIYSANVNSSTSCVTKATVHITGWHFFSIHLLYVLYIPSIGSAISKPHTPKGQFIPHRFLWRKKLCIYRASHLEYRIMSGRILTG